ncbi:hypothetical protein B0T42_02475 [Rathayibacter sp. VKM Ac-2630]|nr:hypothetical protein B0T42_02475 [Rathayibacter sp. VKM Ac-2630]
MQLPIAVDVGDGGFVAVVARRGRRSVQVATARSEGSVASFGIGIDQVGSAPALGAPPDVTVALVSKSARTALSPRGLKCRASTRSASSSTKRPEAVGKLACRSVTGAV